MKKKALLGSSLIIALCLCLIAGSTFALFTSDTEVHVEVTAANLDIDATIDDELLTRSYKETEYRLDGSFANGGEAKLDDNKHLVLDRITPGDNVVFTIKVQNNSNVAIKYRVRAVSTPITEDDTTYKDLTEALVIKATINGETTPYVVSGEEMATAWFDVPLNGTNGGNITDISVSVEFPDADDNNDYKNAKANIAFYVEAIQYNAD